MLRVMGLLVTVVIVAGCAAQQGPPPPPPPLLMPQFNAPVPPPPPPPPASFDGPRPGPSMRYSATPRPKKYAYAQKCTVKTRRVPMTSATGKQYYRVTNYKVCK